MADPIAGKNPYVGPKPFEIGQPLFGRDREVLELRYLLTSERIVLLYSPSGAGKSSLVNAGLIPKLQQRFEIWGPTRVNSQPPDEAPNRYTWSAISGLSTSATPPNITWKSHLARATWKKNPLIIFDQFEEILRVDPVDTPIKRAFFEDLGDALSNPQIWALFILREDYLAPLDPFARLIPTHFQNRYRLDRLTRDAAVEAIEKPTADLPRKYAAGVADTLAQNLATVSVQHLDGTRTDEIGDYVEPLQLQVVCYDLWDRMREDDLSVDPEDVGDVGNALSNYYSKKIAEVAGGVDIIERRIRDWFNDQLITRDGVRNQVRRETVSPAALPNRASHGADVPSSLPNRASDGTENLDQGQSGGLQNVFIDELVDTYIVRQEPRGGSIWYELAHDRLVPPIRQNNEEWFAAHLHKVQQRAVQWQKEEEPASLLLVDKDLEEAEQWASENILQYSEERFLQACRAEQSRLDEKHRHEEEQRRYAEEQLRQAEEKRKEALRFRKLARFATAVSIVAVLGMIGAIVLYFQAQSATKKATDQAEIAHRAETNAQGNAAKAQVATAKAQAATEEANDERSKLAVSLRDTNLALARTAVEEAAQRASTNPGHALAFLDLALSLDPSSIPARSWMTSLLLNARWSPHAMLPQSGNFSPDGHRVLTTSSNAAQLWDAETGRSIGKSMDLGGPAYHVGFSPTSKVILTASGKTVRLWNAETQTRIADLPLAGRLDLAAFSDTASYLATASSGTIQVWNVSTGAPFGTPIKAFEPSAMVLSHDGRMLYLNKIATIDNGATSLADVRSGTLIPFAPPAIQSDSSSNGNVESISIAFDQAGDFLHSFAGVLSRFLILNTQVSRIPGESTRTDYRTVSRDGRFATRYIDGEINIESLSRADKNPVSPLPIELHDERPDGEFSPDSRHLTLELERGSYAFYDIEQRELNESRLPWEDALPEVAVFRANGFHLSSEDAQKLNRPNADGTFLLGSSADNRTNLWKAVPDRWGVRDQPDLTGDEAFGVAYSPDGRLLVSGRSILSVRNSETGAEERRLTGFRYLNSDGRYAVTSPASNSIEVRATSDGTLVGKRIGPVSGLRLTAVSPDARRLVTVAETVEVRLWDLQSGRSTSIPHNAAVTGVAFSPDGKYFLTTNPDGLVRQWQGDTGALLREFKDSKGQLLSPLISPEGGHFFTREGNNPPGKVRTSLWNTGGTAVKLGDSRLDGGAFSPDGQKMVTWFDVYAQIRDTAAAKPIGRLMKSSARDRDAFENATFSRDGARVVTLTEAGIQAWDSETGEPIGVHTAFSSQVYAFALSPDSHQLAAVLGNHSILLTPTYLGSGDDIGLLRAWGQAIGGFRLTPSGSVESIPFPDRLKLIQQLRQSAASAPPGGSSLASHLRRFFALK